MARASLTGVPMHGAPRPGPCGRGGVGRRPVLGAMATLGLGLAPTGCTTWPAPTVPMPVRRVAARCTARERCVLMPGVYSRADDFLSEGFVADLQRAAPDCEVLLADAHLGYFVEGQLLRRLREDVVQPSGVAGATDAAKVPTAQDRPGAAQGAHGADETIGKSEKGEKGRTGDTGGRRHAPPPRPWLVGVSLGGLAALAYAMRHGDEVAGVLAIAPYLGRRELLRDITAAGGPLAWSRLPAQPSRPGEPHAALEDELWRWLARPGVGSAASGPAIFLGYGRDDRFVDAQRVLQALLPPGHGDVVGGGHDWPPWRALWQRWLQRGLLGRPGTTCRETA